MAAASSGPDPSRSAEALLRARSRLLCPPHGSRRLGPEALRTALVDLHELWLSSRAADARIGPGTAVVALGGLARRDLVPHSGLDLLLVYDPRQSGLDPATSLRIGQALWGPLREPGIGGHHAVSTVGETVQAAISDPRDGMGLLAARAIAGDPDLVTHLIRVARNTWRDRLRSHFDELAAEIRARWAGAGNLAQRVEPELNNSHGGLRDIHLLNALATAELTEQPAAEVTQANALILDVRTELRRRSGRARDTLPAQDAEQVAHDLGLADRVELTRRLSDAGAAVASATAAALRAARPGLPRPTSAAAGRPSPCRRPDHGVIEHSGEITLDGHTRPGRDPVLILRVAATAARTRLPIDRGTLHRLAEQAPELRAPWPAAALAYLQTLLGSGPAMINVVQTLDVAGLWARLLPEWGAIRHLAPPDPAHVWTVDRHQLEVCAHAAALTARVSRPDLLLLGALLHDIGRGHPRRNPPTTHHCHHGALLTGQIGHRLGLSPADLAALTAMVRHHQLLPHTATNHNPTDPATAHHVVDTLDGDPILLELLHALTEADARGTAPRTWTTWRATLINDLVRHCQQAMPTAPPRDRHPSDQPGDGGFRRPGHLQGPSPLEELTHSTGSRFILDEAEEDGLRDSPPPRDGSTPT
ncbi:HD domain-containing protein [Actinomycetospora endophytica]|uniref:HD domain-containing protein n=1 Tax=Actinomycetospora endophytica TaxID=2291215 RepID=A0ABS8P5W9_9PSEU|nr:HD domain-containing protein [Actinomycetospora endophytica]MCD2193649.1 HD domain-containing protein [Actinomycetospora endophytica]